MKGEENKKRKFGSQGGGTMSRSFPSIFDRKAVSQPTKCSGFKNTVSESVGQGGRQSRAKFFSQPSNPIPDCKTCEKKYLRVCNQVKGPLRCFQYDQPGHLANNCPQSSLVCFKYGKTGHLKRDCPMDKPIVSGMSKVASTSHRLLGSST